MCIFLSVFLKVIFFTGDQGGEGNHWRPGWFRQVLRVHRGNHQEDRAKLICQMIKHCLSQIMIRVLFCYLYITTLMQNSNSEIKGDHEHQILMSEVFPSYGSADYAFTHSLDRPNCFFVGRNLLFCLLPKII